MADSKGETAGTNPVVRAGYRISRTEATLTHANPPASLSNRPSRGGPANPDSNSTNSKSRGYDSYKAEGDHHIRRGGESGQASSKGGGRGRREKRGGGQGEASKAAVGEAGAFNHDSTINSKNSSSNINTGRWDPAGSPRSSQQQQSSRAQHQQQQQEQQAYRRGGTTRRQKNTSNDARDGHQRELWAAPSSSSRQYRGEAVRTDKIATPTSKTNPATEGRRNNSNNTNSGTASRTHVNSCKVRSPPRSPRNDLYRGSDEREHDRARATSSDGVASQGAGRHISRALREGSKKPNDEEQRSMNRNCTVSNRQQQQQWLGGGRSSSRGRGGAAKPNNGYGREDYSHDATAGGHDHEPTHRSSVNSRGGYHQERSARAFSTDSSTRVESAKTTHGPYSGDSGSGNDPSAYGNDRAKHGAGAGCDSAPTDTALGRAGHASRNDSGQQQYARGKCMTMCPDEERREREEEGGLSMFEATDETVSSPFRERVADPNKAVKKYRRSAAGRNMHSPEQLRPLAVLQTTACYLVKEVFVKACATVQEDKQKPVALLGQGSSAELKSSSRGSSITIAKAYTFVEDRLRAVRQDLTVQGLAVVPEAAEVLKTAANFYVVAGYLVCEEPTDVFDRHLHTRELQGVFSSLAELFFQAKGAGRLCGVFETARETAVPGADEYLALQAVHALATAISNNSKDDDAQLWEAAGGRGVGRIFTTTVSKLCDSFLPPSPVIDKNASCKATKIPLPSPAPHFTAPPPAEEVSTEASKGAESDAGGSVSFRKTFPKMAMAVRLLGVVSGGNWSEFHRILGRITAVDGGELLVGDEEAESPFAIRLRCLCHWMLLPMRAHALRALNKSYGKGEIVPLADVGRALRAPSDDHVARLCRALSLPIEGGNVVFKSVPAVWKTEHAQNTVLFSPPPLAGREANVSVPPSALRSMREDDWVGVRLPLAASADNAVRGGLKEETSSTCGSCGGYGCPWCDNGVVVDGGGGADAAGLWEAALSPG